MVKSILPDIAVDDSLLDEFLQESMDSLSSLEPLFIGLERNPNSEETIQSIFRSVHSLKGNAAFFRFIPMKDLAHALESLLDEIRKNRIRMDKAALGVILLGIDELKAMLLRVGSKEPLVPDPAGYQTILDKIKAAQNFGSEGDQLKNLSKKVLQLLEMMEQMNLFADDSMRRLMDEIEDICMRAGADLSHSEGLRAGSEDKIALRATDRVYLIGHTDVSKEISALIDILSKPIERELEERLCHRVRSAIHGLINKLKGEPKSIAADMAATYDLFLSSTVGFDEVLRQTLVKQIEMLKIFMPPDLIEPTSEKPQQSAQPGKSFDPQKVTRTLRVPEERIDVFLTSIKEISRAISDLDKFHSNLERYKLSESIIATYLKMVLRLQNLTEKLKTDAVSIRTVPLRTATQKLPRLLSDMSESLNKKVRLILEGDEVLLDKSIIESLDDPLIHLLRNAVDHGIEDPDERLRVGKPEEGTIRLSIEKTDADLLLKVSDDGAGIDTQRVRAKALKTGLLSESQTVSMSEKDALLLIFQSGLTTADGVSDLSGRGVGLDIVRTNIRSMNGSVTVESTKGQGSVFTIKIPLTGSAS